MKYAIVEHSGRQYLAQEGSLIEVDRMSLEVGKQVVFKDVLLVSDGKKVEVGAPFVKGASVKGKIQDHPKGKKITVFKYKPKQRYRRTQGHRQLLTHVEIESVGLPTAPPKKKTETKSKSTSSKTTAAGKTSSKKSESSATKKSASASTKKSTSASTKKSTSASTKKSTGKPKAAKKD
ncbi:MAG: 50S ribosomal protein L21 [Anaerolineales bacterium]